MKCPALFPAAAWSLLLLAPLAAQQPPPYTPFVWDEDWSYLSDVAQVADWSDRLHYIPLGTDPAAYLSLSAELRERMEYFDYPAFGAQPDFNLYLLQRYLVGADYRPGHGFEFFVQLGSSLIDGRTGGPRVAIDEERLYPNQALFSYTFWRDQGRSLVLRAGRQLVSLGSTRLVAIGAGLNVQQPFDGARLILAQDEWKLETLWLRPVAVRPGYFDSPSDSQQQLWGLYGSRTLMGTGASLDLYYLGYEHDRGVWLQGAGREERQTLGVRLNGSAAGWYYDWEGDFQFGTFGSDRIRAWAVGTHTGYQFSDLPGRPSAELELGAMSGDTNLHDRTLGTFNSLFPNGSYLGQALLVGPYNVLIAKPRAQISLGRAVTLESDFEFLWRQSLADGIYGIAGYPTHPASPGAGRYIGSQLNTQVDWQLDRHTRVSLDYEHFFPGEYLEKTPPNHGVNFVSTQLLYDF